MAGFFSKSPDTKSYLDCNGNQDIIGCGSNDGNTNRMWFTISPNGELYHDCDENVFKRWYGPLYPGGMCYFSYTRMNKS